MVARFRVVAAASAAALIGSLATTVGQAAADESPPGNGVTFSSQAATVQLVTHFSHSPTATAKHAGSAASSSQDSNTVPVLSPKGPRGIGERARTQKSPTGVTSINNSSGEEGGGTPSPSASFIGMQSSSVICNYFGKGCNPPDMAIAASSQWVFQGVNTSFEVLDAAGNVQPGWPVNAQQFFNVPLDRNADGTLCDTAHGSQPFLSDPRAFYDATDQRFWAAVLQAAGVPLLGIAGDCPLKSVMWVAVSQTSNPNGRWNVYAFNTSLDGVLFNDFTQIGIDSQAVYVSANMFSSQGNLPFAYAELFEGNKAQMEAGKAHFTPDAFINLQANGPGITTATGPFLADTVQPAVNLDSSAGTGETFIDTFDGPDPTNGHFCGFFGGGFADSCSGLALWRLTNPIAHDRGGPAPTLTGSYVATKPFIFSPPSTQPSCSRCVDASDLRISGTTTIRNGIDYGAWETGIDNGSQIVPGIEWVQVNVATGTATTAYYNFTGDASASYGDLMPDSQGNVLMVFDHMSSKVFPEIRYIVKPAGDRNFHGAGVLLKAGVQSYRPNLCGTIPPPPPANQPPVVCRWGDYEATSWDGGSHIWFASQYANLQNTGSPQFGRNWGTFIGAINAS